MAKKICTLLYLLMSLIACSSNNLRNLASQEIKYITYETVSGGSLTINSEGIIIKRRNGEKVYRNWSKVSREFIISGAHTDRSGDPDSIKILKSSKTQLNTTYQGFSTDKVCEVVWLDEFEEKLNGLTRKNIKKSILIFTPFQIKVFHSEHCISTNFEQELETNNDMSKESPSEVYTFLNHQSYKGLLKLLLTITEKI